MLTRNGVLAWLGVLLVSSTMGQPQSDPLRQFHLQHCCPIFLCIYTIMICFAYQKLKLCITIGLLGFLGSLVCLGLLRFAKVKIQLFTITYSDAQCCREKYYHEK